MVKNKKDALEKKLRKSNRNKAEDLKAPQEEMEKKLKAKEGRPPFPYSTELANEICEAIACSPYGLDRICDENPHFPRRKTIYKWVIQIPEFAHKYDVAKAMQTDIYVDDIMQRSYCIDRDFWEDEEGVMRPNTAAIARDKLISDNVKWYASKLKRKKWGDVSTVETKDITHEESLEDLDKK